MEMDPTITMPTPTYPWAIPSRPMSTGSLDLFLFPTVADDDVTDIIVNAFRSTAGVLEYQSGPTPPSLALSPTAPAQLTPPS